MDPLLQEKDAQRHDGFLLFLFLVLFLLLAPFLVERHTNTRLYLSVCVRVLLTCTRAHTHTELQASEHQTPSLANRIVKLTRRVRMRCDVGPPLILSAFISASRGCLYALSGISLQLIFFFLFQGSFVANGCRLSSTVYFI